jgi:hypothetical protein
MPEKYEIGNKFATQILMHSQKVDFALSVSILGPLKMFPASAGLKTRCNALKSSLAGHFLTGCCPNGDLFERSLKRFCKQILAKRKISDVNCLSPKGEF